MKARVMASSPQKRRGAEGERGGTPAAGGNGAAARRTARAENIPRLCMRIECREAVARARYSPIPPPRASEKQ